jgi:hypothetical protein
MSKLRLHLASHEPRFILSEDGRKGKWSQRRLLGERGRKPNSYISTLLMLVAAFAGHELIMKAYREAVRERYRFFSYDDCMLII